MTAADRAGARADENEGNPGHADGRDQHGPPDVAQQEREGDRHDDRRRRLGENAQERDRIRVRLRIVGDAPEGVVAAPPVALEQLVSRGHPQCGLDRRHEAAERDQQERGDEQEDRGHARLRLRSDAWNEEMRRRCSPNISRSSSGSA